MGTQGVGREEKSWGLGGPTKATESLGTPHPRPVGLSLPTGTAPCLKGCGCRTAGFAPLLGSPPLPAAVWGYLGSDTALPLIQCLRNRVIHNTGKAGKMSVCTPGDVGITGHTGEAPSHREGFWDFCS